MNINYVSGDVLTPNKNEKRSVIVCHQVNCMGVMSAGLAKQVATRFPGVFDAYKENCRAFGASNLGDVQLCSCLMDAGYIVANVFGQVKYGKDKRYTDYEALRKAFKYLSHMENTTFRIPYMMGCGLGGGDWDTVLKIITEELTGKGCTVEIWKRD